MNFSRKGQIEGILLLFTIVPKYRQDCNRFVRDFMKIRKVYSAPRRHTMEQTTGEEVPPCGESGCFC